MKEILETRKLQNALTKLQIAKRLIVEAIGDTISNQPQYQQLYVDVQEKVMEVEQIVTDKLLNVQFGDES